MRRMMLVLSLGVLLLNGCSDKGGAGKVDETKPLDQVKADAAKMSTDDLRAQALAYKDAILAKQQDVQKLADQLKGINVTEMLGDKAKTLKADMEKLQSSVSALKERFNVYYNQLQEKKGNLEGLQL